MSVALRGTLVNLPRPIKRTILIGVDGAILLFAVWAAFALRFEEEWPVWLELRLWLFPLALMASIPVFYAFGLYHSVIRYLSGRAYLGIAQGLTVSLLIIIAAWVFTEHPIMPRSIWVNFWGISLLLISSSRLAARALLHGRLNRGRGERVAIYGARESGVQLALALRAGRVYRPMLFIDDTKTLQGVRIAGLKVYPPQALPTLFAYYKITTVLLALPEATAMRRRAIIDQLEPLPVRVLIVPSLVELASGIKRVTDVREVDVEDLLTRDPVRPDPKLMAACVRGKSVMVTGGGGSIGSELCRQVIQQHPRCLIVYERSEYALYTIEQELRQLIAFNGADIELLPVLGSVGDGARVQQVMRACAVDTVYHAAAYKHVSIVEHNPLEGVRNNVLGTYQTAYAARAAGVGTFVLISTDKAVRPTSVMGATKRVAELILQGLAQRRMKAHPQSMSKPQSTTRFCMVRFGNVLASSGSVVPLFHEQIRRGGPVTVTHPEMQRYFMTIPEAAQLVIQAGAQAEGGDVFVLDMGKPIKIVDVARRMIHLHGLEVKDPACPDGDIEIQFTGLRPGEKLYEELLINACDEATVHPMIRRAREDSLPCEVMENLVAQLEQALEELDYDRARELLLKAVHGYAPKGAMADLMLHRQVQARARAPVFPWPRASIAQDDRPA